MLRARSMNLALLPAILIGASACGGEDPADEPNAAAEASIDNASAALMTATSPLVGTFRNETTQTGVAVLTLKADFTYHKEDGIACVRFPCDRPQENGLYRFAQRDGASLLLLVDDQGGEVETFKYLLKGDDLYLAGLTDRRWQVLPRASCAWCAVPRDCSLQDLPRGPCAGDWTCSSNACSYACKGTTSALDQGQSCMTGLPNE